jgi:hypothetical protein
VLPEVKRPKHSVLNSGGIRPAARLNQVEPTPLSGMKMNVEESDQHASRRAVPAETSHSCTIFNRDMGEAIGLVMLNSTTAAHFVHVQASNCLKVSFETAYMTCHPEIHDKDLMRFQT